MAIYSGHCHLDAKSWIFGIEWSIPGLRSGRDGYRLEVVPHRARDQYKRNRITGDRVYGPRREFGIRHFDAVVRR